MRIHCRYNFILFRSNNDLSPKLTTQYVIKRSTKMAGLKILGDLSDISDCQIEFIKSAIEKQGYKDSTINIQPLGKAGDNYIANVKRISIENGEGNNFKMVAKVAPASEHLRQMFNTQWMFHNEHVMYTKILPKFTQLELSANISPQERLRYAKCYGSFEEAPNEVILLEDLNESDFVMLDRMKSLSNDCVLSVLKNFASYHSLSYALKYKEPVLFEEFKNSLHDIWGTIGNREQILELFTQGEILAVNLVEKDVRKKAISNAIVNALKIGSKMAAYERDNKHSIIQQGDAWTNNIMFKFDDGKLKESVMIDYQVSKPTNPVADLLYMIFNCTDHKLRLEHYHSWIDYYHTELDNCLSNHGLKASLVYPRDQLDADVKRFGKVSFGMSLLLAGAMSVKPEEAAAMKEAMENQDMQEMLKQNSGITDSESIILYKKKLEDLVDSFQEFGLI